MRVGIDVHAAEQEGSGNCTYIRGLVRALTAIDEKNDYFLYAVDERHPFYAGLPQRTNIRIRNIGARNPFLRIPFFLAAASIHDKLDILHVQYIAPPIHRGRLTATIHDLGFLRVPSSFSRFFVQRSKILIRGTARRADRIIVGSEYSRQDIVTTYGLPPNRVTVLPYGVDPVFYEAQLPSETELIRRRFGLRFPYILCVGRLNPRKNLPALARAFARFKTIGDRPHQLVIVGKEDFETTRTMEAVRAAGGQDIILTGYVPEADLPALIRGAEIFVYPSLFEGVGLPVMEAMAAGVPVITSATSSMPEIAGSAARLVDPTNEDEITAALAALADNPALREKMSVQGRNRAREFSWEAAARRTLEIYTDVLRPS